MGKQNRQRRAAKAQRRAAHHNGRATSQPGDERRPEQDDTDPPRLTESEAIAILVSQAMTGPAWNWHVDPRITESLAQYPPALVLRELERVALQLIGVVWLCGWQPAELVREMGRVSVANAPSLALRIIAAESLCWKADDLDPRWIAQLEGLGVHRTGTTTGWLAQFVADQGLAHPAAIANVLMIFRALAGQPRLPHVLPPPGSAAARDHRRRVVTDAGASGMLAKVRALLAKAESTTFDAEAEAFTAKAHELMARHAIDEALIWEHSDRDDAPITVRLAVDEPYANAKSLLLHFVAKHNRCSAVFMQRHSMSSIIGFEGDVMTVEVLYTSLLVQAETALREQTGTAPAGSRERSRGFRSSFLMSYAYRIDGRLAEVNSRVEHDAVDELGGHLLPVLVARSSRVEEAVASIFPTLRTSAVRGGSDAAGWAAGTQAANRARLNRADLSR